MAPYMLLPGPDFMSLEDAGLSGISDYISDASTPFKIIIANADLSPGGRLIINADYDPLDAASWVRVEDYDDTAVEDLPIYSLSGAAGTTRLERFGVYFHPLVFSLRGVHPSSTSCVRENWLGPDGQWRNGALTIQVVQVAADGTDAFTTDSSMSAGGVQGVAESGLLWESTVFWGWDGPCFHESDWLSFEP